jgi:hypothetical protein
MVQLVGGMLVDWPQTGLNVALQLKKHVAVVEVAIVNPMAASIKPKSICAMRMTAA